MTAQFCRQVLWIGAAAAAICGAVQSRADQPCPARQTCQSPIDRDARAGCPRSISLLATPSITHEYDGYYIGGGSPLYGDARCPWEGTWGWDYFGVPLDRRVALDWWHGRRYQGGTGGYKTDGPHLLEK